MHAQDFHQISLTHTRTKNDECITSVEFGDTNSLRLNNANGLATEGNHSKSVFSYLVEDCILLLVEVSIFSSCHFNHCFLER